MSVEGADRGLREHWERAQIRVTEPQLASGYGGAAGGGLG